MSATRRLLLLRHGRTTAPPGAYLGCASDPPLSDEGRAQAGAAAAMLGDRPALVVSSPLRRALETAHLVAPRPAVEVDERLRELDFGPFTDLTWAQIAATMPEAAEAWRRDGTPPPGGEPLADLWRRAAAAALDHLRRVPAGDVLLVCHGGVIRALLATARGLDIAESWRVHTVHGGLRSRRATGATLTRWRHAAEP